MLSKKNLLVGALAVGYSLTAFAQGRSCGAHDHMMHTMSNDPNIEARMQQIEQHTAAYLANPSVNQRAAVTIPVVVHVLYNNATANITDAQILSQIAVLNADFAALNTDYNLTSTYQTVKSGNTGVQFCMAKRTPTGAATTGIERKATTKTSFEANTDDAKNATTGMAAWNSAQYLNLWVVPSITSGGQSGILGYAQFPGGAAATDGVVIAYNYFGNTGTVSAPYNKGRTATHEVGHWLNLRHIWGDATCGSDLVTDTPTHNDANYGCPAAGHKSTCTGTPVEMTMNYMDYTDDACMYMFSAGQSARMAALFASGGARASLLTSQGCVAPTGGTTCAVPTALASSGVTATSATLSWGAATGASSYTLQYKTAAATTWTTVTGVGTPTWTLTGLTAATTYNFQVATVCGTTTTAYSTAASFTTLTAGTTTYCASTGNSADEYIAGVKFGTINNVTGNNGGYGNFTALSTTVNRGTAYTITLTPGWTSTVYAEGWKVWIDYNRNGVFDAAEAVLTGAASTTTPRTGTITIPTTATPGTMRMRVQMKYNSSTITACEALTYGEVEDYTINVSTLRESAPSTAADVATVGMIMYPNPTNDNLTVELTQWNGSAVQARMLDLMGRELEQFQINGNNAVLNVANLPSGVYFINITTEDKQTLTQKFVKQ